VIERSDIPTIEEIEKKSKVIDMGHHFIRYTSMVILMYMKILKNQNNNESKTKKQIEAILRQIANKPYVPSTQKWKEYNHMILNKELCLLKFSERGQYTRYYDIIKEVMENVIKKIKLMMCVKSTNDECMCPLESVVLYFMMEITRSGSYSDMSIDELYRIVDIYSKSFSTALLGHEDCLCEKHFGGNVTCRTGKRYLVNHYEQLSSIGVMYDKFLEEHSDVSWLINHNVTFRGKSSALRLYKKFKLIGYTNNDIFVLELKPQLTSLNYNEVLVDSIFDRCLLDSFHKDEASDESSSESENSESANKYDKDKEDYKKFGFKNARTIIFALDKTEHIEVVWDDDRVRDFPLQLLREKLVKYFEYKGVDLVYFYRYYKNKYSERYLNKMLEKLLEIEKLPYFIIKFFEDIKRDKENLERYEGREFFTQKWTDAIENTIDEFV
jgi:hypothetical protein